jgi:hypothetical protein
VSRGRSPSPPYGSNIRRRARRRTAVLLAGLVVLVVAFLVVRSVGGDDETSPTTTEAAATVPDGATTTGASATTTLPAGPQLVASDAGGSRYTVRTNPFTVQMSFTSLCWIEARRGGATGEVLVSRALNADETLGFTESAIWIRVGYPAAASIAVDGVAIPLAPGTDPFNIEVTAAPPGG